MSYRVMPDQYNMNGWYQEKVMLPIEEIQVNML